MITDYNDIARIFRLYPIFRLSSRHILTVILPNSEVRNFGCITARRAKLKLPDALFVTNEVSIFRQS